MKKRLLAVLTGAFLCFSLTACGGGDAPASDTTSAPAAEAASDTSAVPANVPDLQPIGEAQEYEDGTITLYSEKTGLDKVIKNDLFEVTVSDAKLYKLEPNDSYLEYAKDHPQSMVVINMTTKNVSDDIYDFYVDQGTLTDNTGATAEPVSVRSDTLGGTFNGGDSTTGKLVIYLETPPEKVHQVTYKTDYPYDEDLEYAGDPIEFTVSFD